MIKISKIEIFSMDHDEYIKLVEYITKVEAVPWGESNDRILSIKSIKEIAHQNQNPGITPLYKEITIRLSDYEDGPRNNEKVLGAIQGLVKLLYKTK